MTINPQRFRAVMGQFATGVTVLTTPTPQGIYGMTANAVTSVSLEPTLVLVCIARQSRMHDCVRQSRVFALNMLSEEQQPLAERFAQSDERQERFLAGPEYRASRHGAAILSGALAYLDCRVVAEHDGGDHTIFVGEVDDADVLDGQADPLVFFRGRYTSLRR